MVYLLKGRSGHVSIWEAECAGETQVMESTGKLMATIAYSPCSSKTDSAEPQNVTTKQPRADDFTHLVTHPITPFKKVNQLSLLIQYQEKLLKQNLRVDVKQG